MNWKMLNMYFFTLGCGEIAGWRMNLKCKKWLNYHEEFIIKKMWATDVDKIEIALLRMCDGENGVKK
jgi:hypothetical protein